ncbi:MAG: hypothetical protein PWP08_151 [Methanofollis sp.]|nr:hypothetical protein [Methanofollis sp.]
MQQLALFLTGGTLIGIGILAMKSGLGCGLSGLNHREMIGFAAIYGIVAFIVGLIAAAISPEVTDMVIGAGLFMHLIIAAGLVYFGIQTRKAWLSGKEDISRRTYLWFSVPCPACMTATFLACIVLTDASGISGIAVSGIVALLLFAGITISALGISWAGTRSGWKNPSTLGSAMIMLGLFYMLCPLFIPAYIEAQQIEGEITMASPANTWVGLLALCIPVGAGFLINRLTRARTGGMR